MAKRKEPYDVGFAKPPVATQFKSGESGDPKGRPKGAKNLATLVTKIINERVAVNVNGKPRTISKLEATVTQLVNKAATGDFKAGQQLLQLVQIVEDRQPIQVEERPMREADTMVMESLLERLRQSVRSEMAPDSENTPTEPDGENQ